MHFVPFPALTPTERIAGLAKLAAPMLPPAAALRSAGIDDAVRMHLTMASPHPVYVVTRTSGAIVGLDANTAHPLRITQDHAISSAIAHAAARRITPGRIETFPPTAHDQWTVPNGYDPHRPLHRIALNDAAATDLYVSSTTGEVVLDTTRSERRWNAIGSVVHWLYLTALRKHWSAWDTTVWWVSLIALVGVASGSVLGVLRLRAGRSPYRGWMRWHHIVGLSSSVFVLSWMLSGWLSMDHGRLFASGQPEGAELERFHGRLDPPDVVQADAMTVMIEWFAMGGATLTRTIAAIGMTTIVDASRADEAVSPDRIDRALRTVDPSCAPSTRVSAMDPQRGTLATPTMPLVRAICADRWLHVDASTGRLIEVMDRSRRTYQWLYLTLHTWDLPALRARPGLRSALIVTLCTAGFGFGITAVVLGWRRLARGS